MNDHNTPVQAIKEAAQRFVDERDWQQFHHPKELAMDLSCEAAELMELFLWASNEDINKRLRSDAAYRERVFEEIGDVVFALAKIANTIEGCDLTTVFFEKLAKTGKKYSVELSRSSIVKR